MTPGVGKYGSEFDGSQEPTQVTRRIYMVSGGNFVNIWEINGFFPFQESFSLLILPRVYFDS